MLKKIDKKTAEDIYRTRMPSDFPPAELKPWKRIARMWEDGVYFAYGFYENGELMAYAYLVEADSGDVLLDYYAVAAQARGNGIGSRCIRLLIAELQGQGSRLLLIEVENPLYAAAKAERIMQEKRIRFYEKNGLILTEYASRLFGVEYRIMFFPMQKTIDPKAVFEALDRIYHTMFPDAYFGEQVVLHGERRRQ